jgi:hypothetical protein
VAKIKCGGLRCGWFRIDDLGASAKVILVIETYWRARPCCSVGSVTRIATDYPVVGAKRVCSVCYTGRESAWIERSSEDILLTLRCNVITTQTGTCSLQLA